MTLNEFKKSFGGINLNANAPQERGTETYGIRIERARSFGEKTIPALGITGNRFSDLIDREAQADHGRAIKKALSEGKPVPAEVLAEYPDLASTVRGGQTGREAPPTTAAQPRPESQNAQRSQKGQAKAETAVPVAHVLKDFKIKDGDKTHSVARAEVVKKEDGKTFLSATIRGMKGKREIVMDDAGFGRLSAKLSEREAPLPDQPEKFDVPEDSELASFAATYPGYGAVTVYPSNPIPTGATLDDEVVAYRYFRLRKKVPKADQKRFEITIADEHYRISIMRRPAGKMYAQIEYPSAYQHGRDTAGNNAVQVFFRQLPGDADAIRALSPVYDAAKSLFERAEKRADTLKTAPAREGEEQAEAKPAPQSSESPASETPATTQPEKSPNSAGSQGETADKKADIAEAPGGKSEMANLSPSELTGYLNTAGWSEKGGSLLRDERGNVTGRTKWIARDEWWAAYKSAGNGTLTEKEAKEQLKNAIDGKPLSAGGRRLIEFIREYHADQNSSLAESGWLLDAVDLEDSGFDDLSEQERITAQLQAEASRDLGEDAADTIFERVSTRLENATPEQFNEALRAAFDEARQRQGETGRQQAGEPGPQPAGTAERPILESYSIAELRAEEARVAEARADRAAEEKAADQKTRADRSRSNFVLTGSDRPADVAMAQGQTSMLDAMDGQKGAAQREKTASERLDEEMAAGVAPSETAIAWNRASRSERAEILRPHLKAGFDPGPVIDRWPTWDDVPPAMRDSLRQTIKARNAPAAPVEPLELNTKREFIRKKGFASRARYSVVQTIEAETALGHVGLYDIVELRNDGTGTEKTSYQLYPHRQIRSLVTGAKSADALLAHLPKIGLKLKRKSARAGEPERQPSTPAVANGQDEGKPQAAAPKQPELTPAQKNAANRLRAQADTLDARANQVLGADRKTNTARRANQAAGAIGNALSDQAMAKTMRSIADAIESGKTTYLQNITTRAHIEELDWRARLAMFRFNKETGAKYDENQTPSAEHANFARIPELKIDDSYDAKHILEELKGKRGIDAKTRNKIERGYRLTTEEADLIVSLSRTADRGLGVDLGAKKRLAKIGVLSDEDLRAAVLEYLDRKQAKAQEDPIKRMERELIGKSPGIDFFPTPPALADRIVREADIQEGMSVLEPSAGKGDLLDAVRRAQPDARLEAVELSGDLRELLDAKGYALVGSDFEKHDGRYDRIVMNPPFSDSRDIKHVRRAYDMLNPGGRLVAIMGEGAFFRSDKSAADFREWLDSVGGYSEKLPEGSFKSAFRPTGVATRLVVIDQRARQSRPSSAATQPVTVAQARTQLVEALGERHVAALERAGRLKIHESDPTQTGAAGFVDGDGVIHLIPANMDRDALSLALHEGMHLAKDDRFAEGDRAKVRLAHAVMRIGGLKNFIGNPGFSDLVQQVYRMAAEGNPVAVEALNKAKLEGKSDPRVDVAEEAVAYLAEYADQKYPLVRRVLAAIRAALYRMGIKINLTPADVRALALSALKARAKASGKAVAMREAPAYSLPDFAPTAADRAEVERQMKAVKEVRDAEGRLLAPNGKPSNLNERQWKQVRTKFFTDWFGNWESDPEHASKVVDANGEPLVVYHGTASDFKSFDKRKSFDGGFHFGDSASADDRISEHGYGYGANVMPAYLSIRNPSDEDDQYSEDRWATTIKQVKSDGYDGIVYENDIEGGESWVAFDPSQIKSAIGNAGTFSNRSNRIDYSQPTSETDAAEQARLWAEFQAVRAQFQAKEAMKTPFRRWFGHGTEGVTARDGKPLTLYHGTNSPAFHRWDASRAGQSSTHPTAGLGFFMTADKRAAMRYGSRLLELHAKIERPYHLTDADLWAIDSVEAATRLRAKLMAKGYDGAVIAAPGSSPYVIVFESKQAKYTGNEEPTDSEDFRYSRAWHGTPHDVDSFSLDKIGTGEGAQAYGHGLYFTDSEAIAEFYRKSVSADTAGTDERYLWNGQTYADKNDPVRHALSLVRHDGLASTRKLAKEWVKDAEDATERAYFEKLLETAESIRSKSEITSRKGYTYEVELAPRADEYLLWDKPLAQQSDTVKSALRRAVAEGKLPGEAARWERALTVAPKTEAAGRLASGEVAYRDLSHALGSEKAASEYLHSIGVRGIKYLAADSRTKTGKGNHNYVIFDDKDVAVVARYSRPGRPPRMDSPRVAAKVLGDIGELRDALRPGEKAKAKLDPRNWAQMLSDLKSDTRPAWLGLLSQDMLIQLAEKQLPAAEVRKFDDASEKMDAYESKTIQAEAFPLAERWQNLMTKDRQQADAMSRLIYMSTWWGVDPRQSAPDGKRAEWIRAKAVYDAMGAEAKKLYGDVLAFYEKQTERLFAELAARIERHALPDPDKLAAKDMLRQEFERMRKEGPYAPLMRFGDLTVWAEPRDKSDKPVFAAFESVAEQRAFADWLKGEGYRPRLGVKMDEIAKRALPQGDFVGKLAGIIDKTAKGPEAQILKDAMYQLFLRSLPEQAIRKHFIHRKFVPGYSSDALRTFATFARRSAKQTARLAHADRMSDALDKMAAAVRSGAVTDPVAAGHLVNELDKSYQWAMNPTTATWASRLTHLGFLWHLGASPAHLLLNLSQQAQVTAPWLAGELVGKKGFGAVAGALLKANKDFLAGNPFAAPEKRGPAANAARQKLEAEHGGDLGRALKALEEAGKTDKTQTYSIAGLSEEDNFLWTRPWTRKITQGAAWFFHVAEVVNREASAIAAYRLGRDAGMDHEAAYDLARRAINDTHFDYAPSNRARIMRGNVAKVLTLFKQYSLNITWQLGRNAYLAARGASKREKAVARTKLLGMLGMTFVMAGAVGMPFYGEVMWLMTQLLNATRDDDEPEWDADTSFRALLDRAIGTLFGEAAGRVGEQAVRRGLVNAFLGIDLSSRVKLDDLWWRDADSDLQGKQAAYHALEQGLGPVAGLAVRGFATANDAIDALLSGTNARGATWRALEGAMPKAIKDISKGLRFQTEGATTYEGARILEPGELGSAASVGQLMGFTPASLTERYAENRAMTNLQRRIQRQRDALLDSYAMAYRHGDEEIMAALREDMAAFGERYPGKRITGTTLRQSLKARERRREEIERYGGVALDKKLAGMLLEGGR